MIKEELTTLPSYKSPLSELGINIIDFIERKKLIDTKCQFRLNKGLINDQKVNYEYIYIGLRGDKNLCEIIGYITLFKEDLKVKRILCKEEINDFYLLTVKTVIKKI